MDEYERLEEDLQKLYDGYMTRFRNLAFLETQLEEQNRVEQDKLEVRMNPIKIRFIHKILICNFFGLFLIFIASKV